MLQTQPSTRYIGEPVQHHGFPFIVPAPFLYFFDLFEKLIANFYSLGAEMQKRTVTPQKPDGAIRYGKRTKKIISLFNIELSLEVQRYKLSNGKTYSQDMLTLPHGLYDINIVMFAVTLYNSGVSAEMTANILNAYFGMNVSTGTILNWVKRVAELGYQEHRAYLKELQLQNDKRYKPRQIGMDEMYITITADDAPQGISYLVDLERSVIIDVYSFAGKNISRLDVGRVYHANKEYLDHVEVVTTDGAKAYDYFIELIGSNKALHVICVQHRTRNIRKKARTKKLVDHLVAAEKAYLSDKMSNVLDNKKDKFMDSLRYVLPESMSPWLRKILYDQGVSIFEDRVEHTVEKYQGNIEDYLRVYEAYIHHSLYVSEHAALIGRLRMAYNRLTSEAEGPVMERKKGAIEWANTVVYTTAMLEGLNHPIRNRSRRVVRYRDRELVVAMAKLFLLQHNTLSRGRGCESTPYEKIGVPVERMWMNPFARLYSASRRNMKASASASTGHTSNNKGFRVREERYGSWYGTTKELRYPLYGLERELIEEEALEEVLRMRDSVMAM